MIDKGLLARSHIKGKDSFTERAYDLRHRHNLVALRRSVAASVN